MSFFKNSYVKHFQIISSLLDVVQVGAKAVVEATEEILDCSSTRLRLGKEFVFCLRCDDGWCDIFC